MQMQLCWSSSFTDHFFQGEVHSCGDYQHKAAAALKFHDEKARGMSVVHRSCTDSLHLVMCSHESVTPSRSVRQVPLDIFIPKLVI